jgi:hypothetical protein
MFTLALCNLSSLYFNPEHRKSKNDQKSWATRGGKSVAGRLKNHQKYNMVYPVKVETQ